MPITLNLHDSRPTWRWEGESGEWIEGEKPSAARRKKMERKHRNRRGDIDFFAFIIELLSEAITGWDGFVDENGDPVQYKPEMREAFVTSLVESAYAILNDLIDIIQRPAESTSDEEIASPLT